MPKTGFLDGLRAFAAFSVLICHCMIWSNWPGSGISFLPSPGIFAKMAVDLFMILSGFLMAFNATTRPEDTWSKFYVRRSFRIAPAYYVSLFAAVALSSAFLNGYADLADRNALIRNSPYDARSIEYTSTNIWMHLTFLFGLFPKWTFSTQLPDWSLSLEMQFYAVFPALTWAIYRYGLPRVLFALIPICWFVTKKYRHTFIEPSLLPFKLPIFLTGMILCYAMFSNSKSERLLLRIVAVCLTFTQFKYYGNAALWVTGIATMVAFLTTEHPSMKRFKKFLDNPVCKIGSDLSYSVYLFHGFFIAIAGSALFSMPAFEALNPNLRTAVFFLTVFSGTTIVAYLVHSMVEVPFIRFGRLISQKKYAEAPPVTGV